MAWARIESADHLDLHVDPARPNAADSALAWFRSTGAGAGRSVTVLDTERHLVDALRRNDYRLRIDAPFFLHCGRALDRLPRRPQLPDGYVCRSVCADETAARAAVHRAAWRPAHVGALLVPPVELVGESAMSADRYRAVTATWPYRRALDRVVVAPGGTLAAFALAWLDEVNSVGLLEPVGTDPRHARLGLATAVSLAGLYALRAAGATRAVVCPRGDEQYPVPRRLYAALGFRRVARTVTYTA